MIVRGEIWRADLPAPTLDKGQLGDRVGTLDFDALAQIEVELRFALDLAS